MCRNTLETSAMKKLSGACVFFIATFMIDGTAVAMEKLREENLDPVYFLALDGNVKAAMEKLDSIEPKKLTQVELATRRKYLERFGADARPTHTIGPGLVDELTGIYRSYWDMVLLRKMNQREGNQYLFSKLVQIVRRLGGKAGAFSEEEYDRIGEFLTSKLQETGYFAKIGNVKPHMNFMAWKKETTKPFEVDLGDGEREKVDVVLMRDFVSLGWAGYATFDKMHVGGWVGDHALYCVASSYDLESEDFKVSFLAHEARHFSDKRKFKSLSSADLEYRAKLNEIFLAEKSFEILLRKFSLEQRNNPENPHSYASFRLINGVSQKLGRRVELSELSALNKMRVQKAARELLFEDTQWLGSSVRGEL